jgi:hypothetical protein
VVSGGPATANYVKLLAQSVSYVLAPCRPQFADEMANVVLHGFSVRRLRDRLRGTAAAVQSKQRSDNTNRRDGERPSALMIGGWKVTVAPLLSCAETESTLKSARHSVQIRCSD